MTANTPHTPLFAIVAQNNQYVDIAVRGTDEHLGFAIEYAAHPTGIGCFILRFVVHGKGVDPKNYKHLTYRESAQFLIPATDQPHGGGVRGCASEQARHPGVRTCRPEARSGQPLAITSVSGYR